MILHFTHRILQISYLIRSQIPFCNHATYDAQLVMPFNFGQRDNHKDDPVNLLGVEIASLPQSASIPT